MLEKPHLIVNSIRAELYGKDVNDTMNLMAVGPKGHGKTTLLGFILNQPRPYETTDTTGKLLSSASCKITLLKH